METIIVKTFESNYCDGVWCEPEQGNSEAFTQAAACLAGGGLVAFPTETVYGLGADALNEKAAAKIYAAKGRPSDNPLIVHIAKVEDMEKIAYVNDIAKALAQAFWPGPLTMILPKKDIVPKGTTGGLDTVAIRMPSHPVALSLIRQSGVYVAAPSANTSGRPSPTKAEHVIEDMQGKIEYIIDGGAVGIGIESTIVDVSGDKPTILRPGYITKKMLENIVGLVEIDPALEKPVDGFRPKAPGMKYTHYAPKGELTLVEAQTVDELARRTQTETEKPQTVEEKNVLVAEKSQTVEEKNVLVAEKSQTVEEKNLLLAEKRQTAEDKNKLVAEKIIQLAEEKRGAGYRVGIMAPKETISSYEGHGDVVLCVGDRKEQTTVAAGLYAALRDFDREGVEYIYAESFRGEGLSYAIMNRLLKAAGHRVVKV